MLDALYFLQNAVEPPGKAGGLHVGPAGEGKALPLLGQVNRLGGPLGPDPLGLQEYNVANAYHLLHNGYRPPQVTIQWGIYGRGMAQWFKSMWIDAGDACEKAIDSFYPFFDTAGRIFVGIGQAGEGTWNALVYNEELHRGVVFGFRAAGRVNLEAADFVYSDIRNTLVMTYGVNLLRLPEASGWAFAMSVNAINVTSNVVHFQEVAQDVSSDILGIRRDVYNK